MSKDKLVFMDTNILLPQAIWDLNSNHLNKYKISQNGGMPYLTSNHIIKINEVEKSNSELDKVLSYCDRLVDSKYLITPGVVIQTRGMINSISENIDNRANSYFYSLFGDGISSQNRSNSRDLYDKLTDLKQKLSSLEQRIDINKYNPEYSSLHTFCDGFVRAINNYYFDLGKENQKYDGNTDEEIVVCSLFESLKTGRSVEIMSSDIDVHEILSATVQVMETYKPCMKGNGQFEAFLSNPPLILYDEKRDMNYVQRDLLDFEQVIAKFSKIPGSETTRSVEFTKFLERQLPGLKSSLLEV